MSRTRKLLKLLLIAAILAVAAAIAIPNLTRSPGPGQVSPVGSLRTLNTAEVTYASTYPKIGFSPNLAALGGETTADFQPGEKQAGLVDPHLASGLKGGYRFTYTPIWDAKTHRNIGYTAYADPIPGLQSEPWVDPPTWWERLRHPHPEKQLRHFSTNQSGVICYAIGKEVTDDNFTPLPAPSEPWKH